MVMKVKIEDKKIATKNLRSTIASFAVEDMIPSKQALKYCKLRDAGKVSIHDEIEALKEKYKGLARQ